MMRHQVINFRRRKDTTVSQMMAVNSDNSSLVNLPKEFLIFKWENSW